MNYLELIPLILGFVLLGVAIYFDNFIILGAGLLLHGIFIMRIMFHSELQSMQNSRNSRSGQ